jgi:hypothetical protein
MGKEGGAKAIQSVRTRGRISRRSDIKREEEKEWVAQAKFIGLTLGGRERRHRNFPKPRDLQTLCKCARAFVCVWGGGARVSFELTATLLMRQNESANGVGISAKGN